MRLGQRDPSAEMEGNGDRQAFAVLGRDDDQEWDAGTGAHT